MVRSEGWFRKQGKGQGLSPACPAGPRLQQPHHIREGEGSLPAPGHAVKGDGKTRALVALLRPRQLVGLDCRTVEKSRNKVRGESQRAPRARCRAPGRQPALAPPALCTHCSDATATFGCGGFNISRRCFKWQRQNPLVTLRTRDVSRRPRLLTLGQGPGTQQEHRGGTAPCLSGFCSRRGHT